MGHYDECYEMDEKIAEEKKIKELRKWIINAVKKLDTVEELKLVKDVCSNCDDFFAFKRVIKFL